MDDGELPHGYTLDDLTRIASWVARNTGLILEIGEARDAAAIGIIERLYEEPVPTRDDLYQAARRAVNAANGRELAYCGINANPSRNGRYGLAKEYARYWHGRGALVAPFEEGVVDRLAVWQVWNALSPRHQETLWALAEYGDHATARDALGISVRAWQHRISKARIQARALWYAPETPAPQWGGTDRPGLKTDKRGRNKGMTHLARARQERNRAAA